MPSDNTLAGAMLLILILVAAAILLPRAFAEHGGEWVALLDYAR